MHKILIILIIHIIFSYDQNISLIFLCERWITCQAVTSVLYLHYSPETAYTAVQKMCTLIKKTVLALHPCKDLYSALCNIYWVSIPLL